MSQEDDTGTQLHLTYDLADPAPGLRWRDLPELMVYLVLWLLRVGLLGISVAMVLGR